MLDAGFKPHLPSVVICECVGIVWLSNLLETIRNLREPEKTQDPKRKDNNPSDWLIILDIKSPPLNKVAETRPEEKERLYSILSSHGLEVKDHWTSKDVISFVSPGGSPFITEDTPAFYPCILACKFVSNNQN